MEHLIQHLPYLIYLVNGSCDLRSVSAISYRYCNREFGVLQTIEGINYHCHNSGHDKSI